MPLLGHDIAVEIQGIALSRAAIDAADAVIVAADGDVDVTRFAGQPLRAVPTAEAIRHTAALIAAACPATAPAQGAGRTRRLLVTVTSCLTGIAHTFKDLGRSDRSPA